MVSSPELIDDIRKAPDDVLSAIAQFSEVSALLAGLVLFIIVVSAPPNEIYNEPVGPG